MAALRGHEENAPSNFVICVRNVQKKRDGSVEFGTEPGKTLYLEVPDGEDPHPVSHKKERTAWLKSVLTCASPDPHPPTKKNPLSGYTTGDILVFVHGYNNSPREIMYRHNLLQKRLWKHRFQGVIVSFDWPCAESALNYWEDRKDAEETARLLADDGIKVLAIAQRNQDIDKCDIDVHLLGHSTGAYVIREAFYNASGSKPISKINWNVSQVVFIGGDIERSSMSTSDGRSKALFDHSVRITNYQNPFDWVLKLSNLKRVGVSPRIGRVGLPSDAPDTVVNVNVGQHWETLKEPKRAIGTWAHSWHFHDDTFAQDLATTLMGDIDRNAIPTRQQRDGSLLLVKPSRRR